MRAKGNSFSSGEVKDALKGVGRSRREEEEEEGKRKKGACVFKICRKGSPCKVRVRVLVEGVKRKLALGWAKLHSERSY
jgi:hypothetical protein